MPYYTLKNAPVLAINRSQKLLWKFIFAYLISSKMHLSSQPIKTDPFFPRILWHFRFSSFFWSGDIRCFCKRKVSDKYMEVTTNFPTVVGRFSSSAVSVDRFLSFNVCTLTWWRALYIWVIVKIMQMTTYLPINGIKNQNCGCLKKKSLTLMEMCFTFKKKKKNKQRGLDDLISVLTPGPTTTKQAHALYSPPWCLFSCFYWVYHVPFILLLHFLIWNYFHFHGNLTSFQVIQKVVFE